MMKIFSRIGVALIMIGFMSADSLSLLCPICLIALGLFVIKVSGGMKNF